VISVRYRWYFCEVKLSHFIGQSGSRIALLILGLGASQLFAQKLVNQLAVSIGTGNYLGDIGGADEDSHGFLFDLSPQATRFSFSGTYAVALSRSVWLDGQLSVVNLYGDDAFTSRGPRRARNLHFRNTLVETAVRARWQVWDGPNFQTSGKVFPSLYVFAGVGGFYHNPQTRLRVAADNGAAWYDLRDLKTEGQLKPYSLMALSLPVGFGMDWDLGSGWQMGWEASWRWTNTDYLDDVSTTYGNPAEMSELAAQLSSQVDAFAISEANEDWDESQMVHFQYNGSGTTPRGNPEKNDGFGTLQVKMTKSISGNRVPSRARASKRSLRAGKRRARVATRQPSKLRRWFKRRRRF